MNQFQLDVNKRARQIESFFRKAFLNSRELACALGYKDYRSAQKWANEHKLQYAVTSRGRKVFDVRHLAQLLEASVHGVSMPQSETEGG